MGPRDLQLMDQQEPQMGEKNKQIHFKKNIFLFCYVFSNNAPSEEIQGKSWYYGPISRGECDVIMAEKGQDGDFLVRDSESNVSFPNLPIILMN